MFCTDATVFILGHPQHSASAIWSPDGGQIVFRGKRDEYMNLYRKRSSGTEAEQPVLDTGNNVITSDCQRTDGRLIVYTTTTSGFRGVDI